MSCQELVRRTEVVAKKIDSLGTYIVQYQEQLDSLKEMVSDTKDSISSLLSTTLPMGVQWTSAAASVVSLVITAVTVCVVFKIKEKIRKSNGLEIVRNHLLLLKRQIGLPENNRAIASDLFMHFKELLNDITVYKKGYEKNKTLKDRIDRIRLLQTMGRMDVHKNIEEILVEIGDHYA